MTQVCEENLGEADVKTVNQYRKTRADLESNRADNSYVPYNTEITGMWNEAAFGISNMFLEALSFSVTPTADI